NADNPRQVQDDRMVVRQLIVFLILLITSLRGACTASDEAIQSKTLNLLDCFVLITFVLAMTNQ
ncbi:MAG: hypothetical protein LBK53_00600, partial [Heliobacteriaceae bacterium]|nr:hypothetical protein [Heliobacteriaceae bacterium]